LGEIPKFWIYPFGTFLIGLLTILVFNSFAYGFHFYQVTRENLLQTKGSTALVPISWVWLSTSGS